MHAVFATDINYFKMYVTPRKPQIQNEKIFFDLKKNLEDLQED